MVPVVVSCLSQKGGVGKSTLARLVAVGYASNDWSVKIADFNTTQLTSFRWNQKRRLNEIKPEIEAEAYTKPSLLTREPFDLVVADGKPDSDITSLDIALVSDLVIVPTAPTADDLEPQLAFALELTSKGVKKDSVLFVINKSIDSALAVRETREIIRENGFKVAKTEIRVRPTYALANSSGQSLTEIRVATLRSEARKLLSEIFKLVDERTGA